MFCNKCGAKVTDESIYCHKCGNKILSNFSKDESDKNNNINKSVMNKFLSIVNIISIFYCLLSIMGISAGVGEKMEGIDDGMYTGLILIILVCGIIIIWSGKIYKLTIVSHLILDVFLIGQFVRLWYIENQPILRDENSLNLGSHYYILPIIMVTVITLVLLFRKPIKHKIKRKPKNLNNDENIQNKDRVERSYLKL